MADSSDGPTRTVRDNPLHNDAELFEMYMDALTVVLRRPEIRQACREFGVSPATIRMRMMSGAASVLAAAAPEWDVYREAVAAELAAVNTGAAQVTHGSIRDPRDLMRRLVRGGCLAGALMTAGGAAGSVAWAPMAILAQAGATVLVVAIAAWALPRFLGRGDLFRSLGFTQRGGSDMDLIRSRLMTAVRETELLAQVRTHVNNARQDRFGHLYSVAGAPGLSEVYDAANLIPTRVAAEMDELLARFDGASIGVAGPRGAGKSTLVRQYCDEVLADDDSAYDSVALIDVDDSDFEIFGRSLTRYSWSESQPGELRCFVAAPVDYIARDFVLHLFATFCRSVIGEYGRRRRFVSPLGKLIFWLPRTGRLLMALMWRAIFCNAAVLVLVHWKHAIARDVSVPERWVEYAALAVICLGALDFVRLAVVRIRRWARWIRGEDGEHFLEVIARQHLERVRYLQTYTAGWSGTLQLPWNSAAAQYSRSLAQAEQPQSYPEIVDEFRNFARIVAAETHRRHERVFIGIDELDKIGSAENAEQFLNEIKGIFGIPHVYFLVSVSDDALNAFERRGLPLRNAFDSSFDEIMYISALSYEESRRLLYRRVIGLSEPFVALCHCVAGGLARDVIRAARQVVRAATVIGHVDPPPVSPLEMEYGVRDSAAYLLFQPEPEQAPPTLGAITVTVVKEDLLRKLRAVSSGIASTSLASAADLHDSLHQIRQTLMLGQPIINAVDLMTAASPGESADLTSLRLDFAAYTYYCATLQEAFTDQLDRERMIAATSVPSGPGSFDALASARAAFSLDTQLAWRLITQFRKAWSLETRDHAAPPQRSSGTNF
jgi:hypothetical protein